MRTRLIPIVSLVIITMLLVRAGVLDSLVIFILSGAIPGTTLQLPPSAMLLGVVAITWLLVMHMTTHQFRSYVAFRRLVTHYTKRNDRMPKRRYGRI